MKVEQIVTMPIVDPDTGAALDGALFVGKVDEASGGDVADFKSTADPKSYIERMGVSHQAALYALALSHGGGGDADTVTYRLVASPAIKLRTKRSPETAAEYEERCVEWLKSKEYGVLEHEMPVTDARLRAAVAWLHRTVQDIMYCRSVDSWPTNENACHDYNRSCPYLRLCEAQVRGDSVEDLISEGYQERQRHEELELPADVAEHDTHSYSSCKTFRQCARKYYWQYERRIERQHDEGSEALRLGSLFHLGREAYALRGIEAGLAAITEAAEDAPALGDDVAKVDEMAAKARAMLRVAAERWPVDRRRSLVVEIREFAAALPDEVSAEVAERLLCLAGDLCTVLGVPVAAEAVLPEPAHEEKSAGEAEPEPEDEEPAEEIAVDAGEPEADDGATWPDFGSATENTAYRKGHEIGVTGRRLENPHHAYTQPKEFDAWRKGFAAGEAYWLNKPREYQEADEMLSGLQEQALGADLGDALTRVVEHECNYYECADWHDLPRRVQNDIQERMRKRVSQVGEKSDSGEAA